MSASAPGRQQLSAALQAIPGTTRQAALLLHAMPAQDRAWLLAQLAPAERSTVEGLLADLEGLRIPADRALLDEALAVAPPPAPMPAAAAPERNSAEPERSAAVGVGDDPDAAADRSALGKADPARLAGLLRSEPAQLVALLLSLGNWPWREALLQRIGAAKRIEVERRLGAGIPGAAHASDGAPTAQCSPTLANELIRVVVRRLGEARRGDQRGRSGAGWSLSSLLERWRRA